MKKKNQYLISIAALSLLSLLTGCNVDKTAKPANEIHFSLDGIENLTISYDEEDILFTESEGDDLIIKEYMTENKKSYYAKVQQSKHNIQISEGKKPFFKSGFSRYIEVYLPASYQENLTITSTNGKLDLSETDLELSGLRKDCTSGSVSLKEVIASDVHISSTRGILEIGSITAENIRLETTSGKAVCDELEGNVSYISTSGDLKVKSARGSGSYTANNSGKLDVTYTEIAGNLSLYNKNDDIRLTLPKGLEFDFCAAAKNGSIATSFQEILTAQGKTVQGTVGKNPTASVEVQTKNGNIEVMQ